MAFEVETGTGSPAATAYCTAAFMRDLCIIEGLDLTAHNNDALERAIQRATRYIDTKHRFVGYRLSTLQRLEWPRYGAFYRDGRTALDVPIEVREATSFYAHRSLSARLAPDPVYDASGGRVVSRREKVGPIERELAFAADGALATFRRYPEADQRLRELVISGRELLRA